MVHIPESLRANSGRRLEFVRGACNTLLIGVIILLLLAAITVAFYRYFTEPDECEGTGFVRDANIAWNRASVH